MVKNRIDIRWLGRVPYGEALALQEQLVAEKIAARAAKTENPDALLLLEHEPVYTIGRTPEYAENSSVSCESIAVPEGHP